MLICAQFFCTRVVTENLVLSPQGGYRVGEVSLRKGATTLDSKPLIEQGAQAGDWHNCAQIYRPSFRENKPKTLILIIENERFLLLFVKTGSKNSSTVLLLNYFMVGNIANLSDSCRATDNGIRGKIFSYSVYVYEYNLRSCHMRLTLGRTPLCIH
jgi:hypothetical protein